MLFLHAPLRAAEEPAASASASAKKTLEGRVEVIESGQAPSLSAQLLNGGVRNDLPAAFQGKWFGFVRIKQMETYSEEHQGEPYCQQFMAEIPRFFHKGQRGQLMLHILPSPEGGLRIAASSVHLAGGGRVQLTTHRGKALVAGGFNMPTTVTDIVTEMDPKRVEQTRVDEIVIVDSLNKPIHRGFTEVSALYELEAPKRMHVKILDIDYDQSGRPLWKVLMDGDLTR